MFAASSHTKPFERAGAKAARVTRANARGATTWRRRLATGSLIGERPPRALSCPEGPHEGDEPPAVLVGEERFPRGHGALAIRDLPEELAVGLGLDGRRADVDGGDRELQRDRPLAVAGGPVAAVAVDLVRGLGEPEHPDRKSTRLNSSHVAISY